ncbi:MAG TPA: glycosyltransferase family 4 protein, partial [Longimicrobium sp.]|nr:glycosyltransferase family 4 protein [Longimicrobium sp.]
VHVVYNWADETQFFPVPRDRALAERLGMAGKLNVVYAGNIGPMQSVETLLHAADRLRDLEGVQLVIAGGGPREAEFLRLADELKLPNVRWLGRLPLEQMNAVNALSDAMVVHLKDIPLMHSTIPQKLQVALASGRPLLVGVRGCGADLAREAGMGMAFTPEDPDDLARVVRAFAALSPAEREAMGARGRAFYEREISLEVAASRFDTFFRQAARGGHGPASPAALPAQGARP